MNKALIVKDESDVRKLNDFFAEGWEIVSMCPLNPSTSQGAGGNTYSCPLNTVKGRALVIIKDSNAA